MQNIQTAHLNGNSSTEVEPVLVPATGKFSPAAKAANASKYGQGSKRNMLPVSGGANGDGKNSRGAIAPNGTDAKGFIQGAQRVGSDAALADIVARREWVEGSGIPAHLYELNCFVGKDAHTITAATKWSEKYEPRPGKKISKKEVGLGALDLSSGYWYTYRYDWQKNRLDTSHGQFKTLAKSYDVKGRQAKYLSSAGTGNAAYTLRVSRAEIEAVENFWGVRCPLISELESSPDKVSQIYWRWVLESGDVPVAVTEGIKKAACLIGQGIPAIALPGVNNIWQRGDRGDAIKKLTAELNYLRTDGKPVYLAFDSDLLEKTPVRTALQKLGNELRKPRATQLVGANLKVVLWDSVQGKGVDDFLVRQGLEKLTALVQSAVSFSDWTRENADGGWFPRILSSVLEEQMGLRYVVIARAFHRYDPLTGCYLFDEEAERAIAQALDMVADGPGADDEKGSSGRESGDPAVVAKMMECIRQRRTVGPSRVNPARMWLTRNGILKLSVEKDIEGRWSVTPTCEQPQPFTGDRGQVVFTSVFEWVYDPSADRTELDRLTTLIPDEYRETLLDTLACSLDMASAREAFSGRESLPAIFLKGGGSNGKDALLSCYKQLFGNSYATVDLQQIARHDSDSSLFSINALSNATCLNVGSESKEFNLARMETLKKLTTGDPVMIARKGVDQERLTPNMLNVFFTNHGLKASDNSPAVRSRYQVMTLPFCHVAPHVYDAASETERAKKQLRKGDSNFLVKTWQCKNIVPALFNDMCRRLETAMNRGYIDWKCAEAEFDQVILESDHFKGFLSAGLFEETDSEDDFVSSAALFKLYCDYCEEIGRGYLELDGLKNLLRDADPKGNPAKYDALCGNELSFGRKFAASGLGVKKRKKVGGKEIKGYSLLRTC